MSTLWMDFIGAKDDKDGGEYWSRTTCKAPVKLSTPTNQHQNFFYRPDALPVAQPLQVRTHKINNGQHYTFISLSTHNITVKKFFQN